MRFGDKAFSYFADEMLWKSSTDGEGRRRFKRNMHIEIAVDAMEIADKVDQVVLFSGDGDFRPLVRAIQRCGVHVTVVSSTMSQPPIVADELRRQADVFTDLIELKSNIGGDTSERLATRELSHHRLPFLQRPTKDGAEG